MLPRLTYSSALVTVPAAAHKAHRNPSVFLASTAALLLLGAQTARLRRIMVAACLWSLFSSAVSNAVTIDFNSIPGAGPYTGHTEDGFTVTPILGTWSKTGLFPGDGYIRSNGEEGSIETTSAELFRFLSVELANDDFNSTSAYFIEGYFEGTEVFDALGSLSCFTLPCPSQTIGSPDPSALIDSLIIGFFFSSTFAMLVDDIEVSPVPEPATATLLALGLVALASVRRRK